MNLVNGKQRSEKRIEERMPYSGHIFFAAKNGFYEGSLKNYCQFGLFIETKASLSVGEVITIALPYVADKQTKYQGQILWSNHTGFGIELFRKRNVWKEAARLHKSN